MALTKSILTGRVVLPTDAPPLNAELIFTLSGVDSEGGDILPPGDPARCILTNGELPAGYSIWRNTEGYRGTHYIVTVMWTDMTRHGVQETTRELGVIQVGDDPTYVLADLLLHGVEPANNTYWSSITQAEYDAAIQAAADALASATAAALYDGPWLDTVAALIADTSLTYAPALPGTVVAGDYVQTRKEGFAYQVAASGASDQHVTTAGGVKLYVLPGADGAYDPVAFGASADGVTVDDAPLQKAIAALPEFGILDGRGRLYLVGNLWLKSKMKFINFRLKEKNGDVVDFSPVNIGNDLLTADGSHNTPAAIASRTASATAPGIRDILIDNVHIDGNRKNQTKVDYNTEGGFSVVPRDGGRHGFCLKGFNRNITIRNSSARYCATDGILVYRGLNAITVSETNPASVNLRIENCVFEWNRRHGGAGDSIDRFNSTNCKWNNNGKTVDGGLVIGDVGAMVLGTNLYGAGFDMEGYLAGSRTSNLVFESCDFLDNSREGLLIFDVTPQTGPTFVVRKSIRISNCHINAGPEGPSGPIALTITAPQANETLGILYENVIVTGCLIEGLFLFRCVKNLLFDGNIQQVAVGSPNRGSLNYCDGVSILDSRANVKTIQINNSSTVERDDQVLFASDTWAPGTIAAGGQVTRSISVPGAVYGDLVQATLTTLSTGANAGVFITAFVVFPEGSVQVTIRNPTGASKTLDSGTLRVRVSKFDAAG